MTSTNTTFLLCIILSLMRNNMSVKIQKLDYLEGVPQSKIDRINSEVPSKLASMFYISKTNRVSYYSTNSWGDLVVWNKGSLNWEHCPSMLDKELYTLPAKSQPEMEPQEILEETSFLTSEENSEVEITKVTVEPEVAITVSRPTLTKESFNLKDLFNLYLPDRYFIGLPPSNEIAYTVQYEPLHNTWSVWIREANEAYLGGTLYTNSWSCAEKVAEYLTSVNATPDQLI